MFEPLVSEKYEKSIINDVILLKDGFEIKHGMWSFYLTNDKNKKKIVPKIGDTAFFYGDGIGFEVLGIQINNELIFFESREERKIQKENWINQTRKKYLDEYKQLMEKIKDEESFLTINISGMGSGYERACQLMLRAGIKFLDENEFHFDYYGFENIYGVCITDTPWGKQLDKILMDAVGGDCTGAMHQVVIEHLMYIHKNGYEKWLSTVPKNRRYIYPKELPEPSFGKN